MVRLKHFWQTHLNLVGKQTLVVTSHGAEFDKTAADVTVNGQSQPISANQQSINPVSFGWPFCLARGLCSRGPMNPLSKSCLNARFLELMLIFIFRLSFMLMPCLNKCSLFFVDRGTMKGNQGKFILELL
jgi:hypothetical protein